MARLPRPVISRTSRRPADTASSTTCWIAGVSTTGSISLGFALVNGKNLVPSPAAGTTALVTTSLGLATESAMVCTLTARAEEYVNGTDVDAAQLRSRKTALRSQLIAGRARMSDAERSAAGR